MPGGVHLSCPRRSQGPLDAVSDGLVHFASITKTHLDLGGVHVHIHPRWVDLEVQHIDRLALTMQHIFIGAFGGVADDLVAHKSFIHIGELLVCAGASRVRQASSPTHHQGSCGEVHRH